MDDVLSGLIAIVGASQVLTGTDALPYLTDWRRQRTGRALAVVRPADTAQVADIVRLCARHRTPIVAQGGNTGQVAAATPDESGRAIVISLARLNRIRAVDPANDTITVEAGCILQSVQQAAEAVDRLFPLSLGAEGSCTLGGNLATNAGGTQVLRYGNARELTLGLEVVTAEGEVWDGLRGLRKDNTGYDLRDLYIGSEGTLGIITAATLKLFPMPRTRHTALLACASLEQASALLTRARARLDASLTGFEVMGQPAVALVLRTFAQQRLPFGAGVADAATDATTAASAHAGAPSWYVLLECSDTTGEAASAGRFESVIMDEYARGTVLDAALAVSSAQQQAFWHLRESITLALAEQPYCVKHDISLPVSVIPAFVRDTDAALQAAHPGVRMMVFGHLGDGNLHYNLLGPVGHSRDALRAIEGAIQTLVHDRVVAAGGSISAEQGIGSTRVAELQRYGSPVALALMRRIKQALDPHGLLNPGKVLGPDA